MKTTEFHCLHYTITAVVNISTKYSKRLIKCLNKILKYIFTIIMYTALSKTNNIVPLHGGLSLFGPQQLYGQVY